MPTQWGPAWCINAPTRAIGLSYKFWLQLASLKLANINYTYFGFGLVRLPVLPFRQNNSSWTVTYFMTSNVSPTCCFCQSCSLSLVLFISWQYALLWLSPAERLIASHNRTVYSCWIVVAGVVVQQWSIHICSSTICWTSDDIFGHLSPAVNQYFLKQANPDALLQNFFVLPGVS